MKDEEDWMLGQYVLSAFGVVMSHSFSKHSTAEYPKEPIYREMARNEEVLERNSEANEMLAVAEFMKFAQVMKQQGLPDKIQSNDIGVGDEN